jgi:hypothetical protein
MFLPFFLGVAGLILKGLFGMTLPGFLRFKSLDPQPLHLAVGFVVAAIGFALSGMIPLLTDVTFVEAKLGGVIAMFGAIALWLFMPWLDRHPLRSAVFRPTFRALFLVLVVDFLFLGYVGSQPADAMLLGLPLSIFGLIATGYYFAFFLIVLPILSTKEAGKPVPKSIHEAVLTQHKAAKKAAK